MGASGWKQLLAGAPWFGEPDSYRIEAYSEFMPPPRVGRKPYDADGVAMGEQADPWGWAITEMEEEWQLRPGLTQLGVSLVRALRELAHGGAVHGLSHRKLKDNPAWPPELEAEGKPVAGERFVTLLPLALSKTQDDKGRVRWTLFGASEQGPARAFWRSFQTAPRRPCPSDVGEGFVRRLLHAAYGESWDDLADLRRLGFRILPQGDDLPYPFDREGPLPDWTRPYLVDRGASLGRVRYLLTFRPFAALPAAVRRAYRAGSLRLLPYPGSLLFWGSQGIARLRERLPLAAQIPLLHLFPRHEGIHGLRVPQSGLMHEPHADHPLPTDPRLPVRNTYKRTHRWQRLHRTQDDVSEARPEDKEDKVAHVLFSTSEDDMGLYGKPMARNAQVWTHDYEPMLDGPRATAEAVAGAHQRVRGGGLFGYRFVFPPMRVGRHEVYWHRPLVAYFDPATNEPVVLLDAPLGYLTAYPAEKPHLDRPVELWPRPLQREPYREALHLFQHSRDPHCQQTSLNVRMLFDTWLLAGKRPLPRPFARSLLLSHDAHPLEHWLASLPGRATDPARGELLAEELTRCLEPPAPPDDEPPASLTFDHTSRRPFEVAYWKTIVTLAEGRYVNKSNADCVQDPPTLARLAHDHRDLEALGDYLLACYERAVAAAGLEGKALVGELPFRWRTDFDFGWMGGWLQNQEGTAHERDLIVVIPGRDRRRAVIMADHYDTAYMVDCYDPHFGGTGARLAAAGADDNHSATAALLRAAPIFLEMSRRGQLGCDVWLVHLTGEEFPSDCLGARHLSQLLVEGRLEVRLTNGRRRDLSKVRVQGVYVLDMVAHNNDKERDVFQIAPGTGRASLWLAEQAHLATEAWNAAAARWNRRAARKGLGRGQRSADGRTVPAPAAHLPLRGEVRLPSNPRSTLYNTDGQIFSDAGIPVVLFMENYDIDREGYHDTHDTMANIDLDYGAAVTAIAIESVARAATEKPSE